MALADKNGEVMASIPGLADISRVTLEECEAALTAFLSPDKYSRTKTDEGRRIQEIKGGWFLINHPEYRAMASKEDETQKASARMARHRRNKALQGVTVAKNRDIAEAEAEAEASFPSEKNKTSSKEALKVYEAYPKHVGKADALKAIQKSIVGFGFDFVLERTTAYAKTRVGEDPQFTPYPATWFNAQRFNDDPAAWESARSRPSKSPEPKQIQETITVKLL